MSQTQSVCKHCQQPIDFPGQLCPMGRINCVAEPASTGEPPVAHQPNCVTHNRSVCEMCNWPPAARPSGPSVPQVGTISSGYARYCDEVLQLPPERIAAPQTSADPSDYLCGWCHSPLVEIRCPNSNCKVFGLTVARANMLADKLENGEMSQMPDDEEETAAPQSVSGDAPNMNDPRYCGACKHVHPPHEVDCRCYCDKVNCSECGPRIAVRVMAGDAPDCSCNPKPLNGQHWTGCPEKIREDVRLAVFIAACKLDGGSPSTRPLTADGTKVLADAALEALRRYFPPAGQTPPLENVLDVIGGLIATYETGDHADNPCGDCVICTAEKILEELATPASTARTDGEFGEAYLATIERQYDDGSLTWQLIRQLRERTAERNSYDSQRKYLLKKLSAAPGSVPPLKVEIVTPEELERQQNDPTNYMCGVPQAEPPKEEKP